ncbi:MAG: head maturation protease, ClpP-related, partial [Chitinophagaceae bacterium]
DFVKELRALEKQYANIDVRINSGGGDVFDGFAIYNALRQSPSVINTYDDGIAGSMGSIIFQAGQKRYISKIGQVMTHKPSAGGYGNSDEMRKKADLLDSVEDMMCSIYVASTGKTKDECKTKFLNGKDNWFNADQAITENLADEKYDADPIALPASAAMNEEETWKGYNTLRFAAVFTQSQKQHENMELKLSAASLAALNITAAVTDPTAIDSAIAALKVKADSADALMVEKTTAETALADLKALHVKESVTGQLDKAIAEKRITVEQKNLFATQYADKPDDLKALLAVMKPFESVVTKVATAADGTELASLMAKSGEDLFKTDGALERLKALDAGAYAVKYKEYFGSEPPADK